MMAAHLPHWRVHLDAFIFSRLRVPFAWGTNDCALFAADAVRAMTGVDVAADFRGYTSARQAQRLIRDRGGLRVIANKAMGIALAPTCASVGDIVVMPIRGREALGVVVTAGQVAAPGADGLCVTSLRAALCAWRVG